MRAFQRLLLTSALLGTGLLVAGCPEDNDLDEAGENVEEAVDDAERAIEDAAD